MLSLKTNAEILTELGHKVRQRRLEKQLTQQELADKAGIHVNSLRLLERSNDIRLLTFIQILRALGELQEFEDLLNQPLETDLEALSNRKLPQRIRKKKSS